ncbi:MAG: hypothetical protein M3430_00660 [Acidobacteriota bacterium]|nr:hypothetical protein [Acidobacteriota bacterium]
MTKDEVAELLGHKVIADLFRESGYAPLVGQTPTSIMLQFSNTTYSVGEGAGKATITVTRAGDPTPAVKVGYATRPDQAFSKCDVIDNRASERCDYSTTVGTLRFAPGETSKTFVIPISDDAFVEGNEVVNLLLSNPTGGTFGAAGTALLTIIDNDSTPPTSSNNPFNSNAFFVRQQYLDFLNREPDGPGFADWQNVLNGCGPAQGGLGSPATCDRAHVSSGFYRSPEFTDRGYFIYRFYEAALGRLPRYAEFVPDMASISGFQSVAENEASKAEFITGFMARQEFADKYSMLTNAAQAAAFIQKLEQTAGVSMAEPQRSEMITAMQTGQRSAGETLRAFVETKAVFDRFFFRGFVAMQYFGYLRRDPDDAGYDDWVDVMINGRGTVPPSDHRHMIFGFIYSAEYRERFGAR